MKRKVLLKNILGFALSFCAVGGIILLLSVASRSSDSGGTVTEKLTQIDFSPENDGDIIAENGRFRLSVSSLDAAVTLLDKKNDTLFSSTPDGLYDIEGLKTAAVSELSSVIKIKYADRDSNISEQNSTSAAVKRKTFSVKRIKNGARIEFYFESAGFLIPIELTVTDYGFRAEIISSQIKEKSNLVKLTSVTLLPGFSAGADSDDGYVFIPDGCGAISSFGYSEQRYSARIYGEDCAVEQNTRTLPQSKAYLPVFGVKRNNAAFCAIITNAAARAVVKDVGRALRVPLQDVNRITKLIPRTVDMTLSKALEVSAELKELYDNDPMVTKLIDLSLKLEGLPRNPGTHAAGVVISAEPISEFVPLQRNGDIITTQFYKEIIEELGLLKMDFLGLRTLTVIRDTLDFIREQGKKVPDKELKDYTDRRVYEMISGADTDGVFQLESAGMKQFMLQLRPGCLEDLIAGISLFRPGPMDQIPKYLSGKNHPDQVTYLSEKLRPALKATYGCMVYQEQVMRIVRDVAGYSMGRSDLVRRAMAKKKHDVMQKERHNFVYGIEENGVVSVPGAVRNGVDADTANKIFDAMADFASYAFNKPHAACYAVLAYRTAYLKVYYPVEFMTAMLNSFISNVDQLAGYISTARRMGITVLPPDINKSREKFSVEDGKIRFGLAGIRNVGEGAMKDIIKERDCGGSFKDFMDFANRAGDINKRMVEAMIKVGCFDSTGAKRSQLMAVYEKALSLAAGDRKQAAAGQMSLFDLGGGESIRRSFVELPDIAEFAEAEKLDMEHETLGIYLSGHPLNDYADILASLPDTAAKLSGKSGEENVEIGPQEGDKVKIGGIITHVQRKLTRSGSGMMAYCTLEDTTGSIECMGFPSVFTKYSSLLNSDSKVIISGKLNVRDEQENMILIDDVQPLMKRSASEKIYLRLDTQDKPLMDRLMSVLRRFPGNVPVILHDPNTKRTQLAPKELFVNPSGAVKDVLCELLGQDNVKIKKGE